MPLAHVEAGLRSGDLSMPEERNRIETDRLAQLLLTPDERSREQLAVEGVPGRAEVVGDVMADAAFRLAPVARERSHALEELGLEPGGYLLLTIHREANTTPERLGRIVEGIGRLEEPVVFPVHPRTRAALDAGRARARLPRRRPPAARLPRPDRARLAGARDPHRLGRPPEGGLLARRALRDAAPFNRMGGHRRGGRERAGGRRSGPARQGGRGGSNAAGAAAAVRRRPRGRQDRGSAPLYTLTRA